MTNRFSAPMIDSIRVLAMAGIFVHHLWRVDEPVGLFQQAIALICYLGQYGVILFNLITGFVLALPYLGYEERPMPEYFKFIKRRFLRITPIYYLALLLFTALNLLIFTPSEYASTFRRLAGNILFLQGLDPSSLATNTAAYWYLTLLAELYLLFPFLLRLFQQVGPGRACILICSCCWGLLAMIDLLHQRSPFMAGLAGSMIYFNLPARLPELAIGMWLAAAWRPGGSRTRPFPAQPSFLRFTLAAALFSVLCAPFIHRAPQSIRFLFEVSCAFTLFMTLFFSPLVARIGAGAVAKRISAASYGIYIVHQPLFSYAGWLIGDHLKPPDSFALLLIVMSPTAYFLARYLDAFTAVLARVAPSTPQGASQAKQR